MPRALARGNCNISNLKLQWLTFIALFNSILPSILQVLQFVALTDKYFISSCGSPCQGCLHCPACVLHIEWKQEPCGTESPSELQIIIANDDAEAET